MILEDKSDVNADFENNYIVIQQLESLQDKELSRFEEAGDNGNFWDSIDGFNEYRRSFKGRRIGLDAAKMIADRRDIDLEQQIGSLEFKEKIARNIKAGVPRQKLADHFYTDAEEVNENVHGRIRSGTRGLYNSDTPRIIDEAHEGKDTRQIAEVLDIPQETVAEKMDRAGYDSFTMEDTFRLTRGYEVNRNIDPESAIYWLLDRKEEASPEFIGDFLDEAADFTTEPYEMDRILEGLEEEGMLEAQRGDDPYSGLGNREMYSLGSEPADTSMQDGQEKLLEEVLEYEMN